MNIHTQMIRLVGILLVSLCPIVVSLYIYISANKRIKSLNKARVNLEKILSLLSIKSGEFNDFDYSFLNEIESFQTVTFETNEEDFKKISNEEIESSSDDTLNNDNNKINSEDDMNITTIPNGQIDALHSYVDNHISSSTTPEEYADVEANLNNYFNRLYNQYNDSVVAQLESDVKEHLKKNMEFNLNRA